MSRYSSEHEVSTYIDLKKWTRDPRKKELFFLATVLLLFVVVFPMKGWMNFPTCVCIFFKKWKRDNTEY